MATQTPGQGTGRWLDPETGPGRTLAAAVVAAVAAWGVARAALVGITHDEALTLLIHVPGSWGDVFAHRLPIGSNNHLLNTLLLKLLAGVLPPLEWAVRLPALTGLGLYLAGCWRLLGRLVAGPRLALGLALLAANPFLLDLHTLARGYGLGLGLLAFAASCELAAPRRAGARAVAVRHCLAAGLGTLAVAANLSLAFGAAALGILALAGALREAPKRPRRAAAAGLPWLLAGLLAVAVYRPSVLGNIGFYVAGWGGERGFWADTVHSLAAASLYRPEWQGAAPGLTALFAAVLAAGTALAATVAVRRRTWPGLATATLFCWLVAGAMGAARLATGGRWPVDRSAAVLLPALALVLVATWDELARAGSPAARVGAGLAVLLVLLLAGTWASCWNLRRTYLWPADEATPMVMRAVAAANRGRDPGTVRLASSWPLEPAVNFYRLSRRVEALAPVRREPVRPGFDLYYLHGRQREAAKLLGLVVCRDFPRAGTLLAVPGGRPCP